MTKNLAISILAGVSIMGGALWTRIGDAPRQAVTPGDNETNIPAVAVVQTDASSQATDTVIKVADLPNVNGLTTDEADNQGPSAYLPSNQSVKQSPSALAYDDLADKNTLYTDGALKYSAKDIQTKTATNRATLLTYGIDLTKIFIGYPFYSQLTPPEIAFNIYSEKDKSEAGLAELEATRISYEAVSRRLLAASVPSGLADLHIKLTNSADRVSQLIKNMELVKTDKLFALNSARQYVEEAKFLITILTDISIYLKDKNVNLGKDNRLTLAVDVIN